METELAWAAGFFDGEGSSYTIKQKYVQLSVSQQDRRPLDRFAKAVGTGNVRGPYTGKARPKPLYFWTSAGTRATFVMTQLWPFLSDPKKEQFLAKGGDLVE
jgi:hypothetical protein